MLWLAGITGATCRFLMVEPAAGAEALTSAGSGAAVASGGAEPRTGGPEAYLERIRSVAARQGVAAESQVAVHASTAAGILEQAQLGACDIIALATHGRGGAARLLLGSVADKIVRASPVPVLVQRIPRLKVLPIAR